MTKIRFPRPPVRIHVTLERYYSQTTQPQRDDINKTYEDMYCAIQTALYTSTQLFSWYSFDITRAVNNVERVCDYNLSDVLLFDHDLTQVESDNVLTGMALLVTDVYIAINTYATLLLKDGYDITDLSDIINETEWEIFSESGGDVANCEDIALVTEQSISEWITRNGN